MIYIEQYKQYTNELEKLLSALKKTKNKKPILIKRIKYMKKELKLIKKYIKKAQE